MWEGLKKKKKIVREVNFPVIMHRGKWHGTWGPGDFRHAMMCELACMHGLKKKSFRSSALGMPVH